MTELEILSALLRQQRLTNHILRVAFGGQLDAVQQRVSEDEVMSSILRHLQGGALAAGEVKAQVAAETNTSERTVSRRLADMELVGLVEQEGVGGRVRYTSTGLVVVE